MEKTILLGIAALSFGIAATLYLIDLYQTVATICIGIGSFATARALFPKRPKQPLQEK